MLHVIGNTITKLAIGIEDGIILSCVKENLKKENNIVIGLTVNDGLSSSAENIAKLINRKKYFFVPFMQDNPITKPNSLRMNERYIKETIEKALKNKQIQPILV